MPDRYYRGQGKVYFSEKNAATGQPQGGFKFLGNVPELMLRQETENLEHKESQTGQSLVDLRIEIAKTATMMMTLESWEADNLAIALYGTKTIIAGATVTSEDVTAALGVYTPLARVNLTSFTSLTNAGATTTYINGTDYTVDLKGGMLYIPTGGAITAAQALKANYVAGSTEKVSAFTTPVKEYWLRFNGLNTAEEDAPVIIDAYRVRFNPQQEIQMISNELSVMQLEGSVLWDSKLPDTTADGRFFRVRQTQLT